ncbi:MAG: hypothetical protein HY335_07640, partial [Deinococcus sp.]|nr:hypothetical protein [Deinococcus sp.]
MAKRTSAETAPPRGGNVPERPSLALTKEQLLKLYYFMRQGRELENRLVRLYRQGKIVGGVYTGIGNEATAVGSVYALDRQQGDIFAPMHRDLGARLAWGQA